MNSNPLFVPVLAAVFFVGVGCGGNGSNSGRSAGDLDERTTLASAVDDDRVKGPAVCPLSPATDVGTTYAPGPERADLAEGVSGVPLTIQIKVVDIDACTPNEGAKVEIWHADARGEGLGSGYVRGWQPASDLGVVTLKSVCPGWEPTRAPRVYARVEIDGAVAFEGQFFFPEDVLARIHEIAPYDRCPVPDGINERDPVFSSAGQPERLMLDVTAMGRNAYLASLTIALDR